MKRFHLKRPRSLVSNRRYYPVYAAVAVSIALALALAGVLVSRSALSRTIMAGRENLILSIRGNIVSIIRAYERAQLPGADMSGELLPSMRLDLNAAEAMNEVLIDTYGADYAVLSEELFRQLGENLDGIGDTLDKGQSLDAVQTALGVTLGQVETALVARFGATDGLKPVTAST